MQEVKKMAGPTINSKQINGQVQTATEHTIPT